MDCTESQRETSAFVDGELDEETSPQLFNHLSGCPDCRAFMRGILELRSRIHDDILRNSGAALEETAIQERVSVSLALPFVALIVALLLFFGLLGSLNSNGIFPEPVRQGITPTNLSTTNSPDLERP